MREKSKEGKEIKGYICLLGETGISFSGFWVLVPRCLFDMPLDRLKALGADHVLHTAGIGYGHIRVYAQTDQPGGNKLVPLIDTVGYLAAGFGQRDVALRGYLDVAALPELLHGDADAGLFEIKLSGDIYRADNRMLSAQDQDRFQIIFGGLVCIYAHRFHLGSFSCSIT